MPDTTPVIAPDRAPDIVVRPTLKFIHAAYFLILLLILAGFGVEYYFFPTVPTWTPLLIGVLLVWVVVRHVRRLALKLTICSDKLIYEEGMLGKSTRTIQLAKVQDVRVDQRLVDRMFGVGNISIESAGGSSHLTMAAIDRPHHIAEEITNRSERAMNAKLAL